MATAYRSTISSRGTGSRILLDQTLTRRVIDQKISLPDEGFRFWMWQRMGNHANKIAPLFVKLPARHQGLQHERVAR